MKLNVEIETNDPSLGFDLFETKELKTGETTVTIGKGVSATYSGTIMQLSTVAPDIIQLGIHIAIDFGVALASAWLYEKLKGRDVKKLTIERTVVTFNKGQIEKIMTEKLQET